MLIVDDRENDLLKHKLLVAMGEHVKVKRLISADYIIGEIGIEAKEINDLYHSIMGHGRSRTIVGQLHDLNESFERPMLVVYNTKLKPYVRGGDRSAIAREMRPSPFNSPTFNTWSYPAWMSSWTGSTLCTTGYAFVK